MITEPLAEDAVLVTQSVRGDRDAFSALVDRYRSAVFGVALHHLGSREDAQDAAQEALVSAYLNLQQLREPNRFGPWLRRIATNTCADILRRRGKVVLSLDSLEDAALPREIPHPEADPERVPFRLAVRDALERLPAPARLTVMLFYIDGYSQTEVARFLDLPVSTVNSRLQHARRQLRKEMRTMVTDALHEGRPGPEFTTKVVEEALRRGEELMKAHAAGDALRQYDQALEMVDRLGQGREQKQLRMTALWEFGMASRQLREHTETQAALEQALGIAEELGDNKDLADKLKAIAEIYAGSHPEKSEECYRRALDLYRRLGAMDGQISCLVVMGAGPPHDAATKLLYFEEALRLCEQAGNFYWMPLCQAMLDLLQEVGSKRFAALISWSVDHYGFEAQAGAVRLVPPMGGFSCTNWPDDASASLQLRDVFRQISHLGKFLDSSVPVGGGWSGDSHSRSYEPLHTSIQIKSRSERVVVPAGSFDHCLLMEQVTHETERPDEAAVKRKELNRDRCGTRQSWWAPDVGLVQLQIETGVGAEALIQLQEFAVQAGGDGYLPLSRGNSWRYGWGNVPEDYTSTEYYRVSSGAGNRYYLESYSYTYRPGT